MKIKLIDYNWTSTDKETRMVGEHGVIDIKGFSPTVSGDQRSCLVKYADDSYERIFNINRILYFGKEE